MLISRSCLQAEPVALCSLYVTLFTYQYNVILSLLARGCFHSAVITGPNRIISFVIMQAKIFCTKKYCIYMVYPVIEKKGKHLTIVWNHKHMFQCPATFLTGHAGSIM